MRLPVIALTIAVIIGARLPMSAFAQEHHTDQYGLIGDDCTAANPCITAQLQAAQQARNQAAQSPAGQAATKAAADAAEAAREAASLPTTRTNTA